jgi:hypothetical protein
MAETAKTENQQNVYVFREGGGTRSTGEFILYLKKFLNPM